ncbi:hypothetical protein [Pontibacter sp. G13]|uniref:hypothetical protein n=1 Tax=Pontibacter sp. G13 TaxID=3074898 RepID=UPI0028893CCF|nr:hypothetical protein [Pontibacter sp. G13]WNJ19672.1 hypothetical protein RJD25_04250 [Pontibacter sp. G13]
MKKLDLDWFISGWNDFEHKRYLLLAWLQYVGKEFASLRLYPQLSEVLRHYHHLSQYQQAKNMLSNHFPETLDWESVGWDGLTFAKQEQESMPIQEVDAIVGYSLDQLQEYMREGREIYDFLESQISLEPVGISPLYKREGYLLIRVSDRKEVSAYRYHIVYVAHQMARHEGMRLDFVANFPLGFTSTATHVKLDLVRQDKTLPNPATYLLHSETEVPRDEAILPIAKRKVLQLIQSESAA